MLFQVRHPSPLLGIVLAMMAVSVVCSPVGNNQDTQWDVQLYDHTHVNVCVAWAMYMCFNNGACVPNGGSYTCSCPPGYSGRRCQTAIQVPTIQVPTIQVPTIQVPTTQVPTTQEATTQEVTTLAITTDDDGCVDQDNLIYYEFDYTCAALLVNKGSRYCAAGHWFDMATKCCATCTMLDMKDILEVHLAYTRMALLNGMDTVLECEVYASVLTSVHWLFKKPDGHMALLETSHKYEVRLYNYPVVLALWIMRIESSDYGEYTCQAQNSRGMTQKTMVLYEVRPKTTTTTTTSTTTVRHVFIAHSNAMLDEDSDRRMKQSRLHERIDTDIVPYSPKANVKAPGSPPRHIIARSASATTVIVQWEEPEITNGVLTGYKVYYTDDPSQPIFFWDHQDVQANLMTTITDLKANATYTITVVGYSAIGQGPMSHPIQVLTTQGDEEAAHQEETDMSSSEMPASEMPTSEMPPSEMPASEMPTSQMPASEMPTSEMPTSEMPASEMPTSEMPAKRMIQLPLRSLAKRHRN